MLRVWRENKAKKILWGLSILACVICLLLEFSGLGSGARDLASANGQKEIPAGQSIFSLRGVKNKASAVFARLKPLERKNNLYVDPAVERIAQARSIDLLYTKEIKQSVNERYLGVVAPNEAIAHNPYRRAREWELRRLDSSRESMAKWTAKEVLAGRFKAIFRGADKSSGAVQAFQSVKEVMNGGAEEPVSQKISEEERIARAHRKDLPAAKEEEEVIPTRLKTRLNALKGFGQLNFTNPVVTTAVNVSARGKDKVSINMKKDFKDLAMDSNLDYGVNQRLLSFDVNKKITDEISLKMRSQRFTDGPRPEKGEVNQESAHLLYSISF